MSRVGASGPGGASAGGAEPTVYVIDELTGGGIFKFVPDVRGDLSAGQLYAAKGTNADGTGALTWVPLDRAAVRVNARAVHAALLRRASCRATSGPRTSR